MSWTISVITMKLITLLLQYLQFPLTLLLAVDDAKYRCGQSYHFQKNLDTWIQHWMVLYVDEFVAQRVIVMSEWRETALSKQYAFHAWCSSCRALWGHLISWCQCGTASTDVNTHRNKWNFTKPWAFYFDLLDVEFFTSACKLHYQKGRPLRLNK